MALIVNKNDLGRKVLAEIHDDGLIRTRKKSKNNMEKRFTNEERQVGTVDTGVKLAVTFHQPLFCGSQIISSVVRWYLYNS